MSLLVSTCTFTLVSQHRKRKAMSTHKSVSWETIFTAEFEVDVLRGKRPYRPTIWVSFPPTGIAIDYFTAGA